MDEFQEYWDNDRGVVLGGIIVGLALFLVFGAMFAALFGGTDVTEPVESDHHALPALPAAGVKSISRAASMARVTVAVQQGALSGVESDVPDITPETMESLLGHTEGTETQNQPTTPEDTDTSSIDTLATTIASLPEPATADAVAGRSLTTVDKMVQDFEASGQPYPSIYTEKGAASFRDWAQICLEEATAEGIRAEVVYAQSMHETGYLQFGGQVAPSQCNFGGLGATNDGSAGATFADVRTGLRAQVQHLKAYAGSEALTQDLVDERFDLVERGSAPTVIDLGGKWAVPGDTYGQALMDIVNRIV